MSITLHCFGASTPSGQALRAIASVDFVGYSRNSSATSSCLHSVDLKKPDGFHPSVTSFSSPIWISFAPIWLFSSFLQQLALHYPERLHGLHGVIACSSSSSITKRFAVNRYDRKLVSTLIAAEDQLLATCRQLSVPCRILRPTLIYGRVDSFRDNNLSRLLQQLRRFPFLPLPAESGLRQPIHASQLAAVVFHLAEQMTLSSWDSCLPERIALGGDTTLTYVEMISALQKAQPSGDSARRCRLLLIPNIVFFLFAAPLMCFSPKAFEAVFRMGANLSGFTPASQLLGSKAQPFPVLPLG